MPDPIKQYYKIGNLSAFQYLRKLELFKKTDEKAYQILKKLIQNLKEKGLLREENGKLYYNFLENQFEAWIVHAKRAYSKIHYDFTTEENSFMNYIPASSLFALTIEEIYPGGLKGKDFYDVYHNWKKLMNILPLVAILSSDDKLSIGIIQMRPPIYWALQKKYKQLKKPFEECITKECQSTAAYLLIHDNMKNFWNYFNRVLNLKKSELKTEEHLELKRGAEKLKEMWEKANERQRYRFIVFLTAAFVNGGATRDMFKKILKNARNAFSLEDLAEMLSKTGKSWSYGKRVRNFWEELTHVDKDIQYLDNNSIELPKEEKSSYQFYDSADVLDFNYKKAKITNPQNELVEEEGIVFKLPEKMSLKEAKQFLKYLILSGEEEVKGIGKPLDFIQQPIAVYDSIEEEYKEGNYVFIPGMAFNPSYSKTVLMENYNITTGKPFKSYEELSRELLREIFSYEKPEDKEDLKEYNRRVKIMANIIRIYNDSEDIRKLSDIRIPKILTEKPNFFQKITGTALPF